MKRLISAAALAAAWVLSGCAANAPAAKSSGAEPAKPVQTARNDGVVCTMEKPVGSHLPKRVCSTAAQREASRAQAQQGLGPRGGADRGITTGN